MNKFQMFRKYWGLSQCIQCGTNIHNENHHFYCSDCWRMKRLEDNLRAIDEYLDILISHEFDDMEEC